MRIEDAQEQTRGDAASLVSSPLVEILERVHREFAPDTAGRVATYIPELGQSDPRTFGIAVATVDGEVFDVGDARQAFTIQSISKPLVFGMALEECGKDVVLGRVGVEPSGNPFNSVTVDPRSSRPFNPMVNAGAIVTTALLGGADPSERFDRLLASFSRFAGRPLAMDEAVLASERETGDRNRALAWLMRSFGMLENDVDQIVDLYFGQCSVLVTCRDLAVIGATLANGGQNPLTRERAIDSEHVTNVLSVMSTCGMYDNAGEWLYNVGLPAKSGVSGGVLAVLPGQLGIGVFSPPLDEQGNSVRGVRVCERLSHELRLHLLGRTSGVRSVVRRTLRGDEIASSRVRPVAQEDAIALRRRALGLYELQGDLFFATAEMVHRTIVADIDELELLVVDFTHVSGFDEPALSVLNRLIEELAEYGRTVVAVCGHDGEIGSKLTQAAMSFLDADAALEWCEDRLLGPSSVPEQHETRAALDRFDLLDGLGDAELAAIELATNIRTVEAGTAVIREGELADEVFFLLSGRVSVLLPLDARAAGRNRRLATLGPGVAFGELALLDEARRSADVVCDERSTIASLSLEALQQLQASCPSIGHAMHANLARLLARRLRSANAQIRALAR
ncbi:MAG: glutaminase A [Actinomycetota bacterium]|nr:glutaminase A [Actinomycetota bacterium]